MEAVMINAEIKLSQLSSCLTRFPNSWGGFHALRVIGSGDMDSGQGNVFHPAKSIVESYLGGLDGRAYYGDRALHVLCKSTTFSILEEAGAQICDLLSADHGQNFCFSVHTLDSHAQEYANLTDLDCNGALYFTGRSTSWAGQIPTSHCPTNETLGKKSIPSQVKVLLIEDDPVTRWMVRSSLKNECEFACAPTAHKAFSMYAAFNPDVVFLDINLPDDTGYSVLQWIMHNDPGACVVMFSSQHSLSNILESLEKGAMGFVAKPFLRDNLLHYIRQTN